MDRGPRNDVVRIPAARLAKFMWRNCEGVPSVREEAVLCSGQMPATRSRPKPHLPPYDPFAAGPSRVAVREIVAHDAARDRRFPCTLWLPVGEAGPRPLVIYSHSSGGNRRAATFLATHLASHGYVFAAMDHSELVARELRPQRDESPAQRAARVQAVIDQRVPDLRFLLDHLLGGAARALGVKLDAARVGVVGHSFGGWAALAAPAAEPRIAAVVALAPGGASQRKPGILPVTLTFAWGRDVPTLYLVAEDDVFLPLDGMRELFTRTTSSKRMVVLRRADHLHFIDDVEAAHEATRALPAVGETAWIARDMRPITELCSGEQAHAFVRGLTLAHLDAALRQDESARRFWGGDVARVLARRGVAAFVDGEGPPPRAHR